MLISTLYALKATNASKQFGLFFMSGSVPDQSNLYYDREALGNLAVAACRITTAGNTSDYSLTAGSYATLKVGAGQTVWLANNTSTIVIPQTVTMPTQPQVSMSDMSLAVKSMNNKWLLATQTKTTSFTDRNVVNVGELAINQYLTFGFRTATNVTKI